MHHSRLCSTSCYPYRKLRRHLTHDGAVHSKDSRVFSVYVLSSTSTSCDTDHILKDFHRTSLGRATPATFAPSASKALHSPALHGRPSRDFNMGCKHPNHLIVFTALTGDLDVQRQHGWRTAKRPGVDYFIAYLSQFYEIVIFTTQYHYVCIQVLTIFNLS